MASALISKYALPPVGAESARIVGEEHCGSGFTREEADLGNTSNGPLVQHPQRVQLVHRDHHQHRNGRLRLLRHGLVKGSVL